MIIDSSTFIKTPVTKYIKNMLMAFGYRSLPLEYQPIVEYILAMTFLQMTGFLEKKIETILWKIADDNIDYRYDVIHNKYDLFSSYEKVSDIYNNIRNKKNIKNLPDHAINAYKNYADEAYLLIFDSFNVTEIEAQCGSEFRNFIEVKSKFCDHAYITTLYKNAIKHRNKLAHNIDSVKVGAPTISELSELDYKSENYFSRYMIITYMDLVFMNLYDNYEGEKSKILL